MNLQIQCAKGGLITDRLDTVRAPDGSTHFLHNCPDSLRAMRDRICDQENEIIVQMLGHWVSEFEPCVKYVAGRIVGLVMKDDPTETVLVPVP